jgi:hypothetical protein
MNIFNENANMETNLVKVFNLKNSKIRKFILIIIIIILYFRFILNLFFQKTKQKNILKKINLKKDNIGVDKRKRYYTNLQKTLIYEAKMPHLNEIIKKRKFKINLPLPKEIKCNSHFNIIELIILY